jgi:hypothetical protein
MGNPALGMGERPAQADRLASLIELAAVRRESVT